MVEKVEKLEFYILVP